MKPIQDRIQEAYKNDPEKAKRLEELTKDPEFQELSESIASPILTEYFSFLLPEEEREDKSLKDILFRAKELDIIDTIAIPNLDIEVKDVNEEDGSFSLRFIPLDEQAEKFIKVIESNMEKVGVTALGVKSNG